MQNRSSEIRLSFYLAGFLAVYLAGCSDQHQSNNRSDTANASFRILDSDGSGFIEKNEWAVSVSQSAEKLPRNQIEAVEGYKYQLNKLFSEADRNNDGKISLSEWAEQPQVIPGYGNPDQNGTGLR